MWVYLLGVFLLLPCEATAQKSSMSSTSMKGLDGCLDADGYLNFSVAEFQNNPEKVERCLREHLNARIKNGELLEDINIHTIIAPINKNDADGMSTTCASKHATDVTTLSITNTFGPEVPSSTSVLSSPTQTKKTKTATTNLSSRTVFSSPTQTEQTREATANPSSRTVFSSSAHTHTTKKSETNTAQVPVADNCTQICEKALADGSKIIPSQFNAFSPNGTFADSIIIDGSRKQVHCNCMNGTSHEMPSTNGSVIIQRHIHEDANFSRSLSEYRDGFTDRGNVWIGLDALHSLTRNGASMQIELGKWENQTMKFYYIRYRRFYVSSQKLNFSLAVESDSKNASTANDYLDPENTIPTFSMDESSGWWFTNNLTNLNGKSGILWGNVTYNISQMLILPRPDIIGPRLHLLANTLTWTSGKVFCSSFFQRLCKSEELCVKETHGHRFLFDVVPGDHWVPVLDTANEWVEIGDSLGRTCYKHGKPYGPPDWGISTTPSPHKGYVYCCPEDKEESGTTSSPYKGYVYCCPGDEEESGTTSSPYKGYVYCCPGDEEESAMRYQYIGSTATYATSRRHCEKQNLRLCSSVEVCVKNSTIFGVISGDMWVAVNDSENEWVEVGDSNNRTCWIHGLHYGKPPWGNRTDGTKIPHVGYVYCCK